MKFCWAMYMRWYIVDGWKDLGWGLDTLRIDRTVRLIETFTDTLFSRPRTNNGHHKIHQGQGCRQECAAFFVVCSHMLISL